jgi:hypothetical protein
VKDVVTRPVTGDTNRTGIATNPTEARATAKGAQEGTPSREGPGDAVGRVRQDYMRLDVPMGSMPEPTSATGRVKAKVQADPALLTTLLDKLGERLAFERGGVRLYDALLTHVETQGTWRGGPRPGDLTRIRDEEHRHFELVRSTIAELGGDPTALTPAANATLVMSSGLGKVLADPRATVAQCLDAILVAELADNDGWDLLVQLAGRAEATALVRRFEGARDHEREHLARVREWVSTAAAATPVPPSTRKSRPRARAPAG